VTTPAELREMVDEELLNRLGDVKQELFNLRFQHVTGQLDNYARLPQLKREVARLNTILREREIEAAEAIEAAEVDRAEEATGA
jgi:large subunit ribosomal protein L29